jgi:hypothetical protein
MQARGEYQSRHYSNTTIRTGGTRRRLLVLAVQRAFLAGLALLVLLAAFLFDLHIVESEIDFQEQFIPDYARMSIRILTKSDGCRYY